MKKVHKGDSKAKKATTKSPGTAASPPTPKLGTSTTGPNPPASKKADVDPSTFHKPKGAVDKKPKVDSIASDAGPQISHQSRRKGSAELKAQASRRARGRRVTKGDVP